MLKNFLLPASILSGTIIGAGVFALPYVFTQSGFFIGVSYLVLSAVVYTYLYLLYSDIILRTKGEHRFVGYAKKYLGAFASWVATIMTVLGIVLAMTIYLVLCVSFFRLIGFNHESILQVFLFWFIGSFAIFSSLRRITELEFFITVGVALIIVFIFFFGIQNFSLNVFSLAPNSSYILFPLGPIFFALAGRTAIPTLIQYFHSQRQGKNYVAMKRSIAAGTFFPLVVYLLFVVGVISLSGVVTPDAITGLRDIFPSSMIFLIGILGLLSLWSTYILIGLNVSNILQFDFSLPLSTRFLIVGVFPFLLYFFTSDNFIGLVSFTGGIFLSLEGFFIILMWRSINRKRIGKPIMVKRGHEVLMTISLFLLAAAFFYEIALQFL